MNSYVVCSLAHHSPGQIRRSTVCLLIHKIAPSAYSLSDKETDHCNVKNRHNFHFLYFGNSQTAEQRTDYSAVNSKSAVACVDHRFPVPLVLVPFPEDVVYSRADYSADYSADYRVSRSVEVETEASHFRQAVDKREEHSEGDYNSVPLYRNSKNRECRGVYVKSPAEFRKAYLVEIGYS